MVLMDGWMDEYFYILVISETKAEDGNKNNRLEPLFSTMQWLCYANAMTIIQFDTTATIIKLGQASHNSSRQS